MSETKHTHVDTITQIIGHNFRSFGGGREGYNNPISVALKDEPLQFAAGVDIKCVVQAILNESGFYDLLKACMDIQRANKAGKDVMSGLDDAIAKATNQESEVKNANQTQ